MGKRRSLVALALIAAILAGCGHGAVPVSRGLRAAEARVPVVLVPGITASKLRDPATGKLVWGDGKAVFAPHDGGYALARPIRAESVRQGGQLELDGVIERVRFGPIVKDVYGPIRRLLARNGYRPGDLTAPRPDDGFFLFAYDWRQSNAVSAARLADQLERLRGVRGEQQLPVVLICQSNGAHICRWFVKYGGGSLEEAEAGQAGPLSSVRVRKLILVSTANGGSLQNLEWLQRGRRYVPLVGRRWNPETVFTVRAVYEDLPVFRNDLFLDRSGRVLDVDIFDIESWRRYGWSIFDRRVRRRIERAGRDDLFGSHEERTAFLRESLDRAARFHRLLRRDVDGLAATRYYLVQNVQAETPLRAVLTPQTDGWRTHFVGDRWLRNRPNLAGRAVSRGDGHATVESQLWLSPQERAMLAGEPAYVEGKHFDLILGPETQQQLLACLEDPWPGAVRAAGSG